MKTLHLLFLVSRHAIFQCKDTVWLQRGAQLHRALTAEQFLVWVTQNL